MPNDPTVESQHIPTDEEVQACNDDRASDGDDPVTAEDIEEVRQLTPDDEE